MPRPLPLSRRSLAALAVLALGLAAACTDLSYDCVGICGTEVGNGDFEGLVSANSLPDAITACVAMTGCDAGYTATCNCYLQE